MKDKYTLKRPMNLKKVMPRPKKRSKYNNIKTIRGGIKFDSKKEANRYTELRLLEKAGKIEYLRTQVKFDLIPTIKRPSKTLSKVTYTCDFMYKEGSNTIVEDVKGFETAVFKIKMRLFLLKYPQYIFRVT